MSIMRKIKRCILSSRIPPSKPIDFANSLLSLGLWLRQNPSPQHFETREKLYEYIEGLMNEEPFDFIEAGVFRGDSMRYWTALSHSPETRFFGFDTFSGLPEVWHTGLKTFGVGHFDVSGAIPDIADNRVSFYKGRFQETVPGFLQTYRRNKNLVVHCDADVYSSTLYFLTRFHDVMTEGTYLLFDNFSVAPHDFRAFCDYTGAYCRKFEVVASAEVDFEKIAFRLL